MTLRTAIGSVLVATAQEGRSPALFLLLQKTTAPQTNGDLASVHSEPGGQGWGWLVARCLGSVFPSQGLQVWRPHPFLLATSWSPCRWRSFASHVRVQAKAKGERAKVSWLFLCQMLPQNGSCFPEAVDCSHWLEAGSVATTISRRS